MVLSLLISCNVFLLKVYHNTARKVVFYNNYKCHTVSDDILLYDLLKLPITVIIPISIKILIILISLQITNTVPHYAVYLPFSHTVGFYWWQHNETEIIVLYPQIYNLKKILWFYICIQTTK